MSDLMKLKNGSAEPDSLVAAILLSVDKILEKNGLAFYGLVRVCRDRSHKVFSTVLSKLLKDAGLMQDDGTVHDSIRNVVLSGATGEGLGMTWGDPRA